MKLKITLLLLAAALLVAPNPSHAEPLASTAPALCAASASTTPALPGFSTPASQVLLKTIMRPKCGACSGSPCVGAAVASICGVGGGGQYKFCADVGNCPQDGLTQCICKTGPPF
jgi:hypothetical protein